jgi:multidrug efflux pump subunit AcrB
MWIVRLALRRPYTFIVMGLVIVMLGVAAIRRTPTDIFPNIDIPVVSIVWTYSGLSTEEMEQHITTFSEFSTSFAVSNIKNIESQTTNGVAVIKIYFQPDVDIAAATAQVTGVAQTILRRMPPGTNPPFIVRYNASSVPILQMSLSSDRHSESELYDYGIYRIRQQIAVVQGTTFPLPYGGGRVVAGPEPNLLPATHTIGMLARALRLPDYVHVYFHDTDLMDSKRAFALRLGLRHLSLRRPVKDVDELSRASSR